MSVHNGLVSMTIFQLGTEEQKEKYLVPLARGAMIYEGSNEIQSLIQADYALGYRKDKAIRCELPAYDSQAWQS